MLVLTDYPFLDIMWTMFIFFAWVIFIALLIMVLADNFRRNDHSGWAKAAWTVFVIILPLIGVLAYMVARPNMTAQDRELLDHYTEQQRRMQGYSAAHEIEKLAKLRDSGAISPDEFDSLKRKAIVA